MPASVLFPHNSHPTPLQLRSFLESSGVLRGNGLRFNLLATNSLQSHKRGHETGRELGKDESHGLYQGGECPAQHHHILQQ